MALIPTSQKRPWIPAPGVIQLEAIYTYLGQTCENVYHFEISGGAGTPTISQMTAAAVSLEGWEHGAMLGLRSPSCTLKLVRARDISQQNGPVVEHDPTTAVTGTQTGIALPGNVTVAVKWSTGRGGRSFRGRTYHIGLTTNMVTGDQLSSSFFNSMISSYQALLNQQVEDNALTGVVVSYSANKFWRSTAVSTPILAPSIDPNLDSQRRRLAGRGS